MFDGIGSALDGELVSMTPEDRMCYVVFDAFALRGSNCCHYDYITRHTIASTIVTHILLMDPQRKYHSPDTFSSSSSSSSTMMTAFLMKPIFRMQEYKLFNSYVNTIKHKTEHKALIFTFIADSLSHKSLVFKLKSKADNTVDFLVRGWKKEKSNTCAIAVQLWCSVKLVDYTGKLRFELIQFASSFWKFDDGAADIDYNEKIVECEFNLETQNWMPRKIRADKIHPNELVTVKATLANIQENILHSDIPAFAP